jgi:hypothetical protein
MNYDPNLTTSGRQQMSDTPKPNPADAYETMEALLCEMQGLRDELSDVKRERDVAVRILKLFL